MTRDRSPGRHAGASSGRTRRRGIVRGGLVVAGLLAVAGPAGCRNPTPGPGPGDLDLPAAVPAAAVAVGEAGARPASVQVTAGSLVRFAGDGSGTWTCRADPTRRAGPPPPPARGIPGGAAADAPRWDLGAQGPSDAAVVGFDEPGTDGFVCEAGGRTFSGVVEVRSPSTTAS